MRIRKALLTPLLDITVCFILLLVSSEHLVLALQTVSQTSWMKVDDIKPTISSDASPVHQREWTKTPATQKWWSDDDKMGPLQEVKFIPSLWGLKGVPQPTVFEAKGGDDHVRFYVYEIGGSMTKILSTSVNKDLPLIPHVGIRIHGTEWFYSDHVESRKSAVMEKMLNPSIYPQCQFDLGPTGRTTNEIADWLVEAQGRYNRETYDLWNHNCNHFAREFAEFLCPGGTSNGIPKCLMQPIIDVTDNMLDNLPEWRRIAGNVFMDKMARFVVVSWGGVVKKEKERIKQELEQELPEK